MRVHLTLLDLISLQTTAVPPSAAAITAEMPARESGDPRGEVKTSATADDPPVGRESLVTRPAEGASLPVTNRSRTSSTATLSHIFASNASTIDTAGVDTAESGTEAIDPAPSSDFEDRRENAASSTGMYCPSVPPVARS